MLLCGTCGFQPCALDLRGKKEDKSEDKELVWKLSLCLII